MFFIFTIVRKQSWDLQSICKIFSAGLSATTTWSSGTFTEKLNSAQGFP